MAQEAAYFVFHRAVSREFRQTVADSAAASASAPVAGAAGWWGEEPENTTSAAWAAAFVTRRQTASVARFLGDLKEPCRQSFSVRCIFGNPVRPVTLDPTWLSSTVKQLAESIYQERAFDRLPILADALEDAGCGNVDILHHCRQPGEHARGCWVVDLVLGKE